MLKCSTENRDRIMESLRNSIKLCPIELQLHYLNELLKLQFAIKDCTDMYCVDNLFVVDKIPEHLSEALTYLNCFDNNFVNEGITSCACDVANTLNSMYEIDELAALCDVKLNWNRVIK